MKPFVAIILILAAIQGSRATAAEPAAQSCANLVRLTAAQGFDYLGPSGANRWCGACCFQPAGILPCGRDVETHQRFRYQDRSMAAHHWVEWQIPGGRRGGWGGSIAYEGMGEALRRGYSTSATR